MEGAERGRRSQGGVREGGRAGARASLSVAGVRGSPTTLCWARGGSWFGKDPRAARMVTRHATDTPNPSGPCSASEARSRTTGPVCHAGSAPGRSCADMPSPLLPFGSSVFPGVLMSDEFLGRSYPGTYRWSMMCFWLRPWHPQPRRRGRANSQNIHSGITASNAGVVMRAARICSRIAPLSLPKHVSRTGPQHPSPCIFTHVVNSLPSRTLPPETVFRPLRKGRMQNASSARPEGERISGRPTIATRREPDSFAPKTCTHGRPRFERVQWRVPRCHRRHVPRVELDFSAPADLRPRLHDELLPARRLVHGYRSGTSGSWLSTWTSISL